MRGAMSILTEARGTLDRLSPQEAFRLQQAGQARLVDVRMPAHRQAQGEIPGALVIDLTVLPWRLDPTFDWRIPEATDWEIRWVLLCRHSYSSSTAAAQLKRMGLSNATDVIGGVDAWIAAGLPVGDGPADVRY